MKKQGAKILFGPWEAPRPSLRELNEQRREKLKELKSSIRRLRREIDRRRE